MRPIAGENCATKKPELGLTSERLFIDLDAKRKLYRPQDVRTSLSQGLSALP
jgi:hypothetical protein